MCHGYRSRWYRRFEEERPEEKPVTFVSDPEVREPAEPAEPVAEEVREPEREKVPAGVAD
jgi:hypothetical protein